MADDDRASNPGTEPFVPDFEEDTGTHAWVPNFDDTGSQPVPVVADPEKPEKQGEPGPETPAPADSATEAAGVPVQSVTVPGRYTYLKWWKLLLVVLGVWLVVAEIGLGLFSWWYHSVDKTPSVFMVLVYVVACAVGGVMLAMVEGRPLISALAFAVMSGPFASIVAAAPLYGYYYCTRTGHCLIGVIPY
ncbi:hypothetical protein H7H82_01775 [Mycobacterium heidelbergense]|uniref:Uncharacterized protein n=1 Tax=Mycobacterium heidelbergense TaxID=53376 RepID=A0A1X0DBM0_MYCHE|nr:hypothetical protein [Mycobacterium heidelbergense]MCV7049351.1 hypothetical protein [Mycobacterium heidelbergense]ORA69781.1 hypothetical protein BST25_20600 [Mycobacterium heidelbergense]BBZ49659.1 hypothetical protein MHEI_13760 [Mycobacterium heidelbergense]